MSVDVPDWRASSSVVSGIMPGSTLHES
jgi:hypothetical protein